MSHKNTYLFFLTVFFAAPLFGLPNVQIVNSTRWPISVTVSYAGCRSDSWVVQAGRTEPAPGGRGACSVNGIYATVHEKPTETGPVTPKQAYRNPSTTLQGWGVQWTVSGKDEDDGSTSYYIN